MPNHCYNVITTNDDATDRKIAELLRGEGGQLIDFEKVIPMPEELKGEVNERGIFNFPNPDGEETDQGGVPISLGLEFERKYDAKNWYEWRIKNWGSKWNAYSCEDIGNIIPSFTTAWGPPEGILEKLSKLFPEFRLTCDYDIEMNEGGRLELQDGNLVNVK